MTEAAEPATEEFTAIEEGKLLDYITGEPIKDTAKEQVRQRIARALFHEYGISVDDMQSDFPMKVEGRRKKVDIAVFESESEHTEENVRRIVLCQKEPSNGKKGAAKMRDHEQAKKDVEGLQAFVKADGENIDVGARRAAEDHVGPLAGFGEIHVFHAPLLQ